VIDALIKFIYLFTLSAWPVCAALRRHRQSKYLKQQNKRNRSQLGSRITIETDSSLTGQSRFDCELTKAAAALFGPESDSKHSTGIVAQTIE